MSENPGKDNVSIAPSSESVKKPSACETKCPECGKDFKKPYLLRRHLPVHTNERAFTCNVCNKSFRQWSTRQRHMVVHTKARKYVCDICKKDFTRSSTLSTHKKLHSESKDFECKSCGKQFSQKSNLKSHELIHSGERPYRCDLCDYGSRQISNLYLHKSRVHNIGRGGTSSTVPQKKVICQVCGRIFKSEDKLNSHKNMEHPTHDAVQMLLQLKERILGSKQTDAELANHRPQRNNQKTVHLPNGDKTMKSAFSSDNQNSCETEEETKTSVEIRQIRLPIEVVHLNLQNQGDESGSNTPLPVIPDQSSYEISTCLANNAILQLK